MTFDLKKKIQENDSYSDLIWSDKQYIEHISEKDLRFFNKILNKLITSWKISNIGSKKYGVPEMGIISSLIEEQIEYYFQKTDRAELITSRLKTQLVIELFVEFCSRIKEVIRKKENPK